MALMLIDHVGATIINQIDANILHTSLIHILYIIMRALGRISFPIFLFFIIEGFMHIKDNRVRLQKYVLRLFAFALISEIPYDFAMFGVVLEFEHQNVYFTLLFALWNIISIHFVLEKIDASPEKIIRIILAISCVAVSTLTFMILAHIFHIDYGWYAILASTCMYLGYRWKHPLIGVITGILALLPVLQIEFIALCAVPLIAMYNGERGKQNKIVFYGFYPVHLLVLGFIMMFYNTILI